MWISLFLYSFLGEKMAEQTPNKLTSEQIQNWRRILCLQLGPYAFIMPEEEIQAIRDKMQQETDKESKEEEDKEERKESNNA